MTTPGSIRQGGIDWHPARIFLDWDGGEPDQTCDCHISDRPVVATLHVEGFDPSTTAWDCCFRVCDETAAVIEEDLL